MQEFLDLLGGAAFSIILAIVATIARVGHQITHGIPFPASHWLWLLPMAITFGLFGQAVSEALLAYQGVKSAYIGPAIGMGLSLLGPVYFTRLAELLLDWLRKKGGIDEE